MRSSTALHPLLTDLVYAPDGWNLAWTSAIPGPALLAWPLTAVFGPVPAYDVLALAAPALAAWCAYLLCRELGTGGWAALAGGLVFGFGSYEAAETLNHLNLALVFTLPLAALVVARYLRGALSDRWFVALLRRSASLGIFATFLETLFWATIGGARRARRRTGRHARKRAGAPLSAACCWGRWPMASPCSRLRRTSGSLLAHPDPLGISGRGFELDLANLIVPTRVTEIRPRLRARPGGAARRQQPDRAARVRRPRAAAAGGLRALGAAPRSRSPGCSRVTIAVATLCALGARLVVAGHRTRLELPWALVDGLPLASHALTIAGVRARVARARGCVALFLARGGRAALARLRAARADARAEPRRTPLGHEARTARALPGGSLARRRAPGRERAQHPAVASTARRCCGRRRPASASA